MHYSWMKEVSEPMFSSADKNFLHGRPCTMVGTKNVIGCWYPAVGVDKDFRSHGSFELCKHFKQKFLANPCKLKHQFWEYFYDKYKALTFCHPNLAMPLTSQLEMVTEGWAC